VGTAVVELDPRASDEILDRARDEHLPGLGFRCDARADVDGESADLAFDQFALAGVQAGANVES
jgi:hypothetical protein